MRILFLHDNFPAQFGDFARYLTQRGWDVLFGTQREDGALPEVKKFLYKPHRKPAEDTHPYVRSYEKAALTGQAAARAMLALGKRNIIPDIVMAHSGWGPGMYVKEIWPQTKYVGYFEWFYRQDAPDLTFLGEKHTNINEAISSQGRNMAILADLAQCDGALIPTEFQKAQFPAVFSDKLTVMHDGVNTDYYAPANDQAKPSLPGVDLGEGAEIITYVARGMEPYRGFPSLMRALKDVQERRPKAHAVIIGEDRVAYGKKLPDGESYKKRALAECDLDQSRIHFTGLLPRSQYRSFLQASSVHVYLTVPFVLSWSMLEAMSCGCALVASDTAPVREVAAQKDGALLLTDHRDCEALSAKICEALENRRLSSSLQENARSLILERYAQKEIFVRKESWLSKI